MTDSKETPAPTRSELLDVETLQDRQDRLARLLASQSKPAAQKSPDDVLAALNNTNSTRGSTGPPGFPPLGNSRPPFRMEPPTELLARLEAFLPQIRKANETLDPEADNMENVAEGSTRYIEMNLGLGVFEPQGASSADEAGNAPASLSSEDKGSDDEEMKDATKPLPSSDSDSDSDSDSSSDSDADSDEGESIDLIALLMGHAAPPPAPLSTLSPPPDPKQKRPEIVVIGEKSSNQEDGPA